LDSLASENKVQVVLKVLGQSEPAPGHLFEKGPGYAHAVTEQSGRTAQAVPSQRLEGIV